MNKSVWEKIYLGRVVVWYGVNWMIIHFVKASIPPSSLYSIHTFHQNHPWWKISSVARNWINSFPQAAATTFALSSVFILLLWSKATAIHRPPLGSGEDGGVRSDPRGGPAQGPGFREAGGPVWLCEGPGGLLPEGVGAAALSHSPAIRKEPDHERWDENTLSDIESF